MRSMVTIAIMTGCAALVMALVCGPPATVAAAERGRDVRLDQLPEELRALNVRNQFIPGQGTPVGQVGTVRGHLVVRHYSSSEAYFAARGDNLYAHDEIVTLSQSRGRIHYNTDDVVTLGADSRIRADEIVDDRENRHKKTRLNLLRGKAMFYVMRLLKYNRVDAEVHTPNALCRARGTKFGVIVQETTDPLAMGTSRYWADASGAPLGGLPANNGGEDIQTTVITYDGNVMVTATQDGGTWNLGPGQSVTVGPAGAGAAGPADPTQSRSLVSETNLYAGSGGRDGDTDGDGGDTGDDPNAANDAEQDAADRISSVTQQRLQNSRPTRRIGYFAGMLTRLTYYGSPISPTPDHVYVSPESQDHEDAGIVGIDIPGNGDSLTLDGQPGGTATVTGVDSETGTSLNTSNGLGPEHQLVYSEVGFNQFLEWGYWRMGTWMTHSSGSVGSWVFDNAGVYVHGDPTPVENLNRISGHYTGSAWGTLWSASGGTKLSGTMAADVTLGSRTLQNLNVNVSGGGNTVSFVQQSNTYFSGPNGEFMLQEHYGGGNVECMINGSAADHGVVTGGLFGPNGEALAGVAGVVQGPLNAVVGFEGTKP